MSLARVMGFSVFWFFLFLLERERKRLEDGGNLDFILTGDHLLSSALYVGLVVINNMLCSENYELKGMC